MIAITVNQIKRNAIGRKSVKNTINRTRTQIRIANIPNERQTSLDILSETIKGFKGLML